MLKRTRVIILSLVVLALFTVTAGAYQALMKKVTVVDGSASKDYSTNAEILSEFLKEENIQIGEYDHVNISLDANLNDNEVITIKRAVPVNIVIDGSKMATMTSANTVGELLNEKHVVLNSKDNINWGLTNTIIDSMNIEIQTCQEITVTEPEIIPFTTERRESKDILIGSERVVQTGSNGEKLNTYKIAYVGDKETGKEFAGETITKQPINTIIEIGTQEPIKEPVKEEIQNPVESTPIENINTQTVNIGGYEKNYTKVMTVRATAYTPNEGGGNGVTYSGMKARYGVVAIDPNVIPLYSKLYIEGYGEAIAGDTGGAIKGNKIDLCYESYEEMINFGVRNVKVYILE